MSCQYRVRWLNVPRSQSWAAQPNRDAFDAQRAERERLGETPIDWAAGGVRGGARVEDAFDLRIRFESCGHGREAADNLVDQLRADAGRDRLEMKVGLEDRGGALEFFRLGDGGTLGGF